VRRPRAASPTVDSAARFFEELGSRGHEPLVGRASGSARFDLVDGSRTERWLVTIDQGDITVSRRRAAADCVLRVDRAFFERIVSGESNVMAAVLRGEVAVTGDPSLLVLLQRLVPRPGGPRRAEAE